MSRKYWVVLITLIVVGVGGCPTTVLTGDGNDTTGGDRIVGTWGGSLHLAMSNWQYPVDNPESDWRTPAFLATAGTPPTEPWTRLILTELDYEAGDMVFGTDGLPSSGLTVLGVSGTPTDGTATIYQPGQSHVFHTSTDAGGFQVEMNFEATVREATYGLSGFHVVIDLTQTMSTDMPNYGYDVQLTGTQTIDVVVNGDTLTYTSTAVLRGSREMGADLAGNAYLHNEIEYTGTLQRQ